MTTYSTRLRLTYQDPFENDSTWGTVANQGVFQLIEDALAGMVSISLTAGNVTLTANNGSTDQARYMILNLTGSPGAARSVTVPSVSKVYVIINATTGSQPITIKTSAGTGVVVPDASTVWVYCDGTDVYAVSAATAASATSATNATNSAQLGGVVAASYARLDVQQGFTKAQNTTRVTLTESGGAVAVNATLSNAFRLTMAGNWTLSNPTGGLDGQALRILIKQDAGGNRLITWGSAYKFPNGVAPTLSTAANARDYASFEYDATDGVWVGALIKGLA